MNNFGALIFLIYTNNLHKAINCSKIHHFADETNFLYESPSLKFLPCQAKCPVSQKVKTKTQTEYFRVILHEHLHFKKQTDTVKQKLLTTTGLPSKLRHYVPKRF